MSLVARLQSVSVPPARRRRKPGKVQAVGLRYTPLRSRGAPVLPRSDGRRYARMEISGRMPARC
jgi:hypothetical protein